MKIAITGASGFIGTALCRTLATQGHDIVRLRLRPGAGHVGMPDAAAVIHLAGIAHARASAAELDAANVALAREVGLAAAASGARMVFLSSIKVYGEQSEAALTRASPLRPEDEYGLCKLKAEQALNAIARLKLVTIRPPLVYGPGVKANFLALLRAIARGWPLPFASIRNRRSFVYSGNLADFIARCLSDAGAEGVYLPCDGAPVSTPQLCRELAQALQRPSRLFRFPPRLLELLPGAQRITRSLYLGDSPALGGVGWQAPYARARALEETVRWFRGR